MKNKSLILKSMILYMICCLVIYSFACTPKVVSSPPEQNQPLPAQTPQPQASPIENVSSPDLATLQSQIKIDASNFNKLLEEFSTFVLNIKDPCNLDMKTIFPDDWMFEIYVDKDSGSNKYALAMPIPPDIMRGFQQGKTVDRLTSYTFGEYLKPFTDLYISPTWNGQPYNWTGWIGIGADIAKYPLPVSHDYLATQKMCKQPYFIPDEAKYGVYTGNWTGKNCTANSLSKLVYEITQINPYKDEPYKVSSIMAILDTLSSEVIRLKDDVSLYSKLADGFNNVYFKPNASIYKKGVALGKYQNDMTTISDQLSKINAEYIDKIKMWDFSNLDRYREIKNK